MTELYEKSLRKLELDNVLAQLADCANSEDGKDRCRALLPLDDAEEICLLQQQTTAACGMIVRKGAPGFHELKPVAASLERADRGGCLTPVELLRIAGVLRCIRNVKAYYSEDGEPTVLDVYFQELSPNRYLEEKITNSILSEEEIADAASSELADIRRHMRIQSAKVKDSLQKIISSPSFSKYLRDPIITLRGDRYVVPVKSEYKSEIPGLVHDVSSTGSTFFIEPMSAVNANNALRELLIREKKEIERILAALSAEAASFREGICHSYEMLVQLDCIFARARLSHKMDGMEPEIRTNASLELVRARHPLIDRKKVVPVSLRLGSDFDTLIITGPNTGGKTVTLKTIGLLTLMAECGLHIPADHGSAISVFRQVLADIGDEQSIEQSLSTFSAHMKNIVDIVADCDRDTLVLFDELGAGTDPAEGAALANALIEFCRQCGSRVAATTHYAELKLYAMRTEGVMNASCEFDVETLRPTYRLLIGIPGKSNAFAISRRLGLPDSMLGSAWPAMTVSLNAPLWGAGLIQMLISFCTIISSLNSARLIRKFGTGRLTAISVATTALALLGFSLAKNYVFLLLMAVPLGLGAGAVDAGLNNFVALHYEARHMSWLHCFWGVGATLGPVILSLFLRGKHGWRGGYGAVCAIQFCLVAVLAVTLPMWDRYEDRAALRAEAAAAKQAGKKQSTLNIPGVKGALATFFFYCAICTADIYLLNRVSLILHPEKCLILLGNILNILRHHIRQQRNICIISQKLTCQPVILKYLPAVCISHMHFRLVARVLFSFVL